MIACESLIYELAAEVDRGSGRLLLASEEALCLHAPSCATRSWGLDMQEYAKVSMLLGRSIDCSPP